MIVGVQANRQTWLIVTYKPAIVNSKHVAKHEIFTTFATTGTDTLNILVMYHHVNVLMKTGLGTSIQFRIFILSDLTFNYDIFKIFDMISLHYKNIYTVPCERSFTAN